MKRFRVQIALRIIALSLTLAGSALLAVWAESFVAAALVLATALVQIHSLVKYVDKTNRDLARLLEAIRYADFSQAFTSDGRGGSYEDLTSSLRKSMEDFRNTRSEKEEHYRYLQTVMQHVGVGLISFKQDGSVGLINNAAKRLLRVTHLKNVKALTSFSNKLSDVLLRLRAGEKTLVQAVDDDELLQLMVYATEFKLREELFTLVSIQNIQAELEEKEIESWQKLTRVLTHEIMNSITPIASLASTANVLLAELSCGAEGDGSSPAELISDVRGAVRTIERRSQSLLGFVNAYRSLTRIPRPEFRIFSVAELFDNVCRLMAPDMEASGIQITTRIHPERLDVTADPELIEQVLINLVKNAKEAVAGVPSAKIELTAFIDQRGRVVIQVIDNGPGIVEEAIDKIFIPFFTTKKEGSGIGLSLSRQIMRQHGGTLSVFSEPDHRTVFTIRF
jgi:two-component system, NtrC family, nitrogen regulation sensor histidine kinase NtrY